ncbi:MAG: sensor histidine kinase [Rudaea sp.]
MGRLFATDTRPVEKVATVFAEALRGITARHLRVALVFGGVFWLVTMLIEWQYMVRFRGWRGAVIDFVDLELGALLLLLAVSVADAAIAHGARRRTAYVAAALAGCAVSQISSDPVQWLGIAIFGPIPWGPPNEFATPVTTYIYRFTHWLLFVGSGVFLYAQWRAAHQMQEYLRAAELDRVRKARLALESRLQALQARVEPGFLFRTLSQVRDLYDRDVVLASVIRASKMLDDLIAYLRAAMPHMRDTASTVEREIELARAYLDIARLRLDERLGVDVTVSQGAGGARMPPMMLLPLIEHALAASGGPTSGKPAIRVDVRTHGDRLQASVTHAPGASTEADPAMLADIRERLSGLYGTRASLRMTQPTPECIEVQLEIPLEFAHDMDSIEGTEPM